MKFCISAVVGLALLAVVGVEVSVAQTVTSYDTSTVGFSIQCDPVPGRCTFDLPSSGSADYSTGTYPLAALDQFPFITLSGLTEKFQGTGCTADEGCSISCDDECSCITGELGQAESPSLVFTPDGGTCPILTLTPGVIQTLEPSSSPSDAPSVNLATTTLYYAPNGLVDDAEMILLRCSSSGALPFELCKLVQGDPSYTSQSPEYIGWVGPCIDCVVRCSEACTCEIASNIMGEDPAKIGDCAVLATEDPTEAPSSAAPSSASAPTQKPTASTATKFMGVHLLFLLVHVGCWAFIMLQS